MPDADPPIVITGGSVTLKKSDELPEVAKGEYSNPTKTLKRITINGDGVNYTADFPTGRGVTIKVFWDNSTGGETGGGK